MDWIRTRHRHGFDEAWSREQSRLANLGFDSSQRPELSEKILLDWTEVFLAEGVLSVRGERRSVPELLLGPGGPLMTAEERGWIQAIADGVVGLYEVLETRPGQGLGLQDSLDQRRSPVEVNERTASKTLQVRDLVGVRIVEVEGSRQLANVYTFHRHDLDFLRRELRERVSDVPEADRPRARSPLVRELWTEIYAVPRPLPTLVDAATGEKTLLINDIYDVLDWSAVEERLTAEPDVVGDHEHGWSRLEQPDEEWSSTLWAVNPRGHERLEVFCRSQKRADTARPWAEGVLGDAVRYLTREIIDPTSSAALAAMRSTAENSEILPEAQTELRNSFLQQHYMDWADVPVPMLGDRTPREAMQSPGSRRKVVELLRLYEHEEASSARAAGHAPFDFSELWRSVGLNPAEHL